MSEPKKYSLKPIETQVLTMHRNQLNTMISNVMSMIAMERLAYQVTDKTLFQFNPEMTEVIIQEQEESEKISDLPDVVTEAPKGKK